MLLLLRETMTPFSLEMRKTGQREKVLQNISLVKSFPCEQDDLQLNNQLISEPGKIYQVYLGEVGGWSLLVLFAWFYNPLPFNLHVKIHLLPLLTRFSEPSMLHEEPPKWQNRWHLLNRLGTRIYASILQKVNQPLRFTLQPLKRNKIWWKKEYS